MGHIELYDCGSGRFRNLQRYLLVRIVTGNPLILLDNTAFAHAHHKQSNVRSMLLILGGKLLVKSWIILSKHSCDLNSLLYVILRKDKLSVIHNNCFRLFRQEANCWLPQTFELHSEMILREWAANNQLVKMLHEVFNPHYKDTVILVPLMTVTIAFECFLVCELPSCLYKYIMTVEAIFDFLGPETFI